ncbi:YdeI/OmpD-associated family protein [Ignavibacterium album]|uniref:YdeI/OmpD-associated family protein n=1 Tax=Ignavibacterium album TaxID=591197 RepID=UPI0035B9A028
MKQKDSGIDSYIHSAADFAKPILNYLRGIIHNTCPAVQETIKWGFPHFVYKDEILCSMAAFKHHCAFGFWKAQLMKDKTLIENAKSESAMGHFGKITSLKDLPSEKKLISLIKEAMTLNEKGIKVSKKIMPSSKEINVPDDFLSALSKNKKAKAVFDAFPPSHKREYIDWITEAKRAETRQKRIRQAIEWISEGKHRNWKYMKQA